MLLSKNGHGVLKDTSGTKHKMLCHAELHFPSLSETRFARRMGFAVLSVYYLEVSTTFNYSLLAASKTVTAPRSQGSAENHSFLIHFRFINAK